METEFLYNMEFPPLFPPYSDGDGRAEQANPQKVAKNGHKVVLYSINAPLGNGDLRHDHANFSIHRPRFHHTRGFHPMRAANLRMDPLSALRRIRKRLEDLEENNEMAGMDIRAQICRMAIGRLKNAEGDIEGAERKRREAMASGDEAKIGELDREIRASFDRALEHTELLLDRKEAKLFGLHSPYWDWNDHHHHHLVAGGRRHYGNMMEEEDEKGRGRRRRGKRRRGRIRARWKGPRKDESEDDGAKKDKARQNGEDGGDRIREGSIVAKSLGGAGAVSMMIATAARGGTAKPEEYGSRENGKSNGKEEYGNQEKRKEYDSQERGKEYGNPIKGEEEKKAKMDNRFKQYREGKRRNGEGRGRVNFQVDDEEEEALFLDDLKSSANMCPYCHEQNALFGNQDFLHQHFAELCPWLCRCVFCDKVIEIHQLNEHLLKRCPFVGGALTECHRCGIPRYPHEPEGHPKCRYAHPPRGGAWCPACLALIRNADSRAEWHRHLTRECRNNARERMVGQKRDGADRHSDLLTNLEESLAHLETDELPLDDLSHRPAHFYSARRFPLGGPTGAAGTIANMPGGGQVDVQQLKAAVRRLNHERRVKSIQRNIRMGRKERGGDADDGEGQSSDSE